MSARSNGDKPPHTEYTAPSRKNARAAQKPLRDIGVERFMRPHGALVGEGHVRQGSAFDMLGKRKKEVPKSRKEKLEVARDRAGKKNGAGDEDDLDGKTGSNNKTNDPLAAPDGRGDTPAEAFNATDWDETLWENQDEFADSTEQEKTKQESSKRVLQTLRPNVVRPATASRNLKAKAGAWGTSKLQKPTEDVANTLAPPIADRATIRRRILAVKNRPTAEERFRKDYFERTRKSALETTKRQAPAESPSPPRRQPPQKGQRKRKASPPAPVFSTDEAEDKEDDEDLPIGPKDRRRRATPASRPQRHSSRNQKGASALPDKGVHSQEEDDEDGPPIVQTNRRHRAQSTVLSRSNDTPEQHIASPLSSNSKAAAGRLLQTVQEVFSPLSVNRDLQDNEEDDDEEEDDDDDDDDLPAVQPKRRRRVQPAPPPQTINSANQGAASLLPSDTRVTRSPTGRLAHTVQDVAFPLSDNAAVDQLLQLRAPLPLNAPDLSHIPMARFPPTNFTSGFKAVNSQPKRARATTITTATAKKDTTPSPPRKKSRAAPKGKSAKTAAKPAARLADKPTTRHAPKTVAKTTAKPAVAKPEKSPAAPVKKTGAAAIAGKKGMASKPVVKKKRKAGHDSVSASSKSTSDHDDWLDDC